MTTLKVIIVLALLILVGEFYVHIRAEEIHWNEEAVLQDSRTITIQRTAFLSFGRSGEISEMGKKWPHNYSLKVIHPNSGKLIEWEGDYGFNPILLDFFEGVPYLVILQDDVFADLKQYGCPEIPYVFFRYDLIKKHWEQVPGSVFPSVLGHANLTAFYQGGYIHEAMLFTAKNVAIRNDDAEVETGGYFSNTIPKEFNSWTFKRKNEEKKRHFHDGCRPPPEFIPSPPPAQQVNLEIIEKKYYEPEWVIKNPDAPYSPWKTIAWDTKRNVACKKLLRPEDPQVAGWNYFVNDPSGQKKIRVTGPMFCDLDTIWAIDYAAEKGRVVIAKYNANGDLAYRASFAKPDEPDWYHGAIMETTLKSENGCLSFDWWNFERKGDDVHVKRSMKVKLQEPQLIN